MKAAVKTTMSSLSFHEGNALLQLAKSYPLLIDVIRECVQNALDSSATSIWVAVNYPKRTVTVRDNGNGVGVEKFEKALNSVCHSIKTRADDLGQFGIGLISPLGKCEEFTFTSTPKAATRFKRWRFVTTDLESQAKIDRIPVEDMPQFVYGQTKAPSREKTFVPWRTEVALREITTDRVISRIPLDDLKDSILSRFGEKMRKVGSTIVIRIVHGRGKAEEKETFVAPEFQGERLPIVRYTGKDCGKTEIELYLSRKTTAGRKGKVLVGIKYDLFRVDFHRFSASCGLFSEEVTDILNSGIFEGRIISEKCALLKERNGFEMSDPLVEFCTHIEQWVREEGIKHVARIKDEQRDQRYQLLGIRSIKAIEEMLHLPHFKNLLDVIKSIKVGSIGTGHVEFDDKTKEQEISSLTTRGTGVEHSKDGPDNVLPLIPSKEPIHREGYVHNTVTGKWGGDGKWCEDKAPAFSSRMKRWRDNPYCGTSISSMGFFALMSATPCGNGQKKATACWCGSRRVSR